jgi:hypothetical protein
MKVRGNQRPAQFWLEVNGNSNTATAYFTENVKEIDESGEDKPGFVGWEYDRYKIARPYDSGLQSRIEADISGWITYAKFHEKVEKSEVISNTCEAKLSATDWKTLRAIGTFILNSPTLFSAEQIEDERYRQALRDCDSRHINTYPDGVLIPEPPTGD